MDAHALDSVWPESARPFLEALRAEPIILLPVACLGHWDSDAFLRRAFDDVNAHGAPRSILVVAAFDELLVLHFFLPMSVLPISGVLPQDERQPHTVESHPI